MLEIFSDDAKVGGADETDDLVVDGADESAVDKADPSFLFSEGSQIVSFSLIGLFDTSTGRKSVFI